MDEGRPFGLPVSLGGDPAIASLLAVGKPGFDGSGREIGSVATYERGERGWKAQAELELAPGERAPGAIPVFGPDPGSAFFGAFVKLEGLRLAVVSTFANTAYIFERSGADWAYQYRITPGAEFGDDFQRRTVAMSANRLVMGSPGELGADMCLCTTLRLNLHFPTILAPSGPVG